MKYFKILSLALIIGIGSRKFCSAATATHITILNNNYIKKGKIAVITVIGQYNGTFGETNIDEGYINFKILDDNGNLIIQKKIKINYWEGNSQIEVNTDDLTSGNYLIHAEFEGNTVLRPSNTYSSLIIFENENGDTNENKGFS